jgi:hypothetical protein
VTSTKDSGKDFSLKEGEKISINIPGLAAKKTDKPTTGTSLLGGGGLKKLAPPPGAKKSSLPPPNAGFGIQ